MESIPNIQFHELDVDAQESLMRLAKDFYVDDWDIIARAYKIGYQAGVIATHQTIVANFAGQVF